MKAPLIAASVLVLVTSACGVANFANPLPGDPDPSPPKEVRRSDVAWNGFRVTLEPTVMVWAQDADVDIRREVRRALAKAEGVLHGPPVQITIEAGNVMQTIPDVGIGGTTDVVNGEVRVDMDSRSPLGLRELLMEWLPLALAHELHHSKRILDGPGYGVSLLQAMITEGAAEAFVRSLYPNAPPIPWVRPMSPREESRVWRRAQAELRYPDNGPTHHTWFYGGGDLPRWAGYKVGYRIVTAYLGKHPDVTAADLAELTAGEIYSNSDYRPAADR